MAPSSGSRLRRWCSLRAPSDRYACASSYFPSEVAVSSTRPGCTAAVRPDNSRCLPPDARRRRSALTLIGPRGRMAHGGEPALFRVGVDIGGTFTDLVFLDPGGRLQTKKVSSSVDDSARAIIDGLADVFPATRT